MRTNNKVIQLNQSRKLETLWLGSHEIDTELLFECAYYPRPPSFGTRESSCTKCSFIRPLETCKYAHILTFSEYEPKKKRKKKDDFDKFFGQLSEEEMRRVREYIEKRKEMI